MTTWQKQFKQELGIHFKWKYDSELQFALAFISSLLESQAKEIELWARKNKIGLENGDVVGLGQLIKKLTSLKSK